MRELNSITHSMTMSLTKLREIVKDRGAWYAVVIAVMKTHTYTASNDYTNLNCDSTPGLAITEFRPR